MRKVTSAPSAVAIELDRLVATAVEEQIGMNLHSVDPLGQHDSELMRHAAGFHASPNRERAMRNIAPRLRFGLVWVARRAAPSGPVRTARSAAMAHVAGIAGRTGRRGVGRARGRRHAQTSLQAGPPALGARWLLISADQLFKLKTAIQTGIFINGHWCNLPDWHSHYTHAEQLLKWRADWDGRGERITAETRRRGENGFLCASASQR